MSSPSNNGPVQLKKKKASPTSPTPSSNKKRKPLKLSSPKSTKAETEKNKDNKFHNRLETFGVNTGDCGFRLLCPRSDTKEAYTAGEDGIHNRLVEIMTDDVQSQRLRLQACYPMCNPLNHDQPLPNERTSAGSGTPGHWQVYLYSHDNPLINTAVWRGKWGRNFAAVITKLEEDTTYQYKNGFTYCGDTTPNESQAYLGDYLTTEDLLIMLKNTHGDDFSTNMADTAFVNSYFGESNYRHAIQMAARMFGIQVADNQQQPDFLEDLNLEAL